MYRKLLPYLMAFFVLAQPAQASAAVYDPKGYDWVLMPSPEKQFYVLTAFEAFIRWQVEVRKTPVEYITLLDDKFQEEALRSEYVRNIFSGLIVASESIQFHGWDWFKLSREQKIVYVNSVEKILNEKGLYLTRSDEEYSIDIDKKLRRNPEMLDQNISEAFIQVLYDNLSQARNALSSAKAGGYGGVTSNLRQFTGFEIQPIAPRPVLQSPQPLPPAAVVSKTPAIPSPILPASKLADFTLKEEIPQALIPALKDPIGSATISTVESPLPSHMSKEPKVSAPISSPITDPLGSAQRALPEMDTLATSPLVITRPSLPVQPLIEMPTASQIQPLGTEVIPTQDIVADRQVSAKERVSFQPIPTDQVHKTAPLMEISRPVIPEPVVDVPAPIESAPTPQPAPPTPLDEVSIDKAQAIVDKIKNEWNLDNEKQKYLSALIAQAIQEAVNEKTGQAAKT